MLRYWWSMAQKAGAMTVQYMVDHLKGLGITFIVTVVAGLVILKYLGSEDGYRDQWLTSALPYLVPLCLIPLIFIVNMVRAPVIAARDEETRLRVALQKIDEMDLQRPTVDAQFRAIGSRVIEQFAQKLEREVDNTISNWPPPREHNWEVDGVETPRMRRDAEEKSYRDRMRPQLIPASHPNALNVRAVMTQMVSTQLPPDSQHRLNMIVELWSDKFETSYKRGIIDDDLYLVRGGHPMAEPPL